MNEDDFQLLAMLDLKDRARVEAIVDEIIDNALPDASEASLRAAAASFDKLAAKLSKDHMTWAREIAAALRARAAQGVGWH